MKTKNNNNAFWRFFFISMLFFIGGYVKDVTVYLYEHHLFTVLFPIIGMFFYFYKDSVNEKIEKKTDRDFVKNIFHGLSEKVSLINDKIDLHIKPAVKEENPLFKMASDLFNKASSLMNEGEDDSLISAYEVKINELENQLCEAKLNKNKMLELIDEKDKYIIYLVERNDRLLKNNKELGAAIDVFNSKK